MYSLSLSVAAPLIVVFVNLRQLEFIGSQFSHVLLYIFLCLFFVAPFSLLAVFTHAFTFNKDVSNWNTAAVTDMYGSKCDRSLSLSAPRRLPLWCVVEYMYMYFRRITSLTHFVVFFFVV